MERVKDALNKARVERHETLGITEVNNINTHSTPPDSPVQDLRNMMYVSLALITFSVAGLLFLFWYISDLKRDFINQNDARVEVSGQLLKTPESSTTNLRVDQQIAHEVSSNDMGAKQSAPDTNGEMIDVYYGDALIRMQVVGKLSGSDADYVAALDHLKQDNSSPASAHATIKAASQTVRTKSSEKDKSVDHFNRIIVDNSSGGKTTKKLTFAGRVQQAVNVEAKPVPAKGKKDSYIAKLDQASAERKNETRIIKIRRGDSLWKISRRAYGTGFKYPLIFKANPHLKNPNKIEVGEFLRVPLS
jgi:nucleoid-associated protein YgaU